MIPLLHGRVLCAFAFLIGRVTFSALTFLHRNRSCYLWHHCTVCVLRFGLPSGGPDTYARLRVELVFLSERFSLHPLFSLFLPPFPLLPSGATTRRSSVFFLKPWYTSCEGVSSFCCCYNDTTPILLQCWLPCPHNFIIVGSRSFKSCREFGRFFPLPLFMCSGVRYLPPRPSPPLFFVFFGVCQYRVRLGGSWGLCTSYCFSA